VDLFRISVRGRGSVARRWIKCGGRGWASPQKKIIFVPKITSLCVLTQFLTGKKHRQSLENLEHGFYGSIT